jgi:hypothetical protein
MTRATKLAAEIAVPDTPAMRRFAALAETDQQYAAAYYLFTCLRWPEKRRAVFGYVIEYGIDKAGLLKAIRPWSHGEQILVKVALDLFDPGCVKALRHKPAGFGEAVNVLDDEHIDEIITAIRIARGEIRFTPTSPEAA